MVSGLIRVLASVAPVPHAHLSKPLDKEPTAQPVKSVEVQPRRTSVTPKSQASPLDPRAVQRAIFSAYDGLQVVYPKVTRLQCTKVRCTLCLHMFTHVNLSRYVGHSNCHPCGWYPHLAPALVHGLRKVHDQTGTPLVNFREPVAVEITPPWSEGVDSWSTQVNDAERMATASTSSQSARGGNSKKKKPYKAPVPTSR